MSETINLQLAAQAFMNRHRVTCCWEVKGKFFKRLENAKSTGQEPREYRLSAGIRSKKRQS